MKLYDIIQVEDSEDFIIPLAREAEKQAMSHLGVGSLNELEETLVKNRAKVYVVDGRFPVKAGGEIDYLALRAAEMIRNCDPEAKIMLYSANDLSFVARKINAEYASKGVLPDELMEKIKQMIGK